MPNWCNNDIRIYGNEGTIRALTNVIKSSDGKLFQTLIGLPDNMSKSNYELNWYDTNLNWFGTKWDVDVSTDCFTFSEGEICFFCETAWSPPIQFLENLCGMYKLNAYIFYSEGGVGFSGETNLIWQDGELSVVDTEYEYNKGLYLLSKEEFWGNMESNIEYAVEEDMSVDDFIGEYKAYVLEKDIQDIITMFNEQKKAYDEQESEVE
jgi:hypothetical protein